MGHILTLSVLISMIGLTACQKAKMRSVPGDTQKANPQGPPVNPPPPPNYPNYNPPPAGQPPVKPPPAYQPPAEPPVVHQLPPSVSEPRFQSQRRRPLVEWSEVPSQPAIKECGNNCATQKIPIPEPGDCRENQACPPPQPIEDKCEAIPLTPDKEVRKLDILFVVDTSSSLRGGRKGRVEDGELAQLALGMENFVKKLNPATDYRIGVLLGHGPNSRHHGQLFSSGKHDPAVIEYKPGAEREIVSMLQKKMIAIPPEANKLGSAQGEALLLALYNSTVDKKHNPFFQEMRSQGMFRDEASLAVIMVSDEQDVCFDYEGTNFKPSMKKSKNNKGEVIEVPDKYENHFFENICKKAVNGKPLTPGHVYDALVDVKGNRDRLIVTGIVYTNNATKPPVGIEDENEMGHGIIDVIQMAGGQMADLANVDRKNNKSMFANELSQLGEYAHFKLKYNNVFVCQSKSHAISVDRRTVEVEVVDSKGQVVASFNGKTRGPKGVRSSYVEKRKNQGHLEVAVDYETLAKQLTEKQFQSGEVRIKFKTRADIDPVTGNPHKSGR